MTAKPPLLLWRLRPLMAHREIYTVRELQRRLAGVGHAISEVQLGRVRKAMPKLLDTRLLAALCAVLDVSPGELLVRPGDPVMTRSPAAPPGKVPTAASAPSDRPISDTPVIPDAFPLAGPKIGAMRARDGGK